MKAADPITDGADVAKPGNDASRTLMTRLAVASRVGRILQIVGVGVLLLLLWQLAHTVEVVSRLILPSPLDTGRELWRILNDLVGGGITYRATLTTTTEVLIGFALAAVAGIAFGIVVGETKFGKNVLMPYVVALNAVPKVAFAPLFVAWLGFGIGPKVALAAFIAFFPVLVSTVAGIESYSRNHAMLFRSMNATRWQILWRLKLPNSLPYIFAGLKAAAVLAVVGAIVAEFMGGGANGLGELIRISSARLRTDSVFAYIVILSSIGVLLYTVLSIVESRLIFWRTEEPSAGPPRG